MTERTKRLDELLREEISQIVAREIEDPRVGFVTVTKVEVAPDLRHATVWASVIGSDEERKQTIRALGRAMPFVRHRLGELRLKRIPELHLREDRTAERGTRVMRILDDLEEGRDPDAAPTPETLPTPGGRPAPDGSA
jgi:ribosome-binding factor A